MPTGPGSLRERRRGNREALAHRTGDGALSGSGCCRPQRFAASRHCRGVSAPAQTETFASRNRPGVPPPFGGSGRLVLLQSGFVVRAIPCAGRARIFSNRLGGGEKIPRRAKFDGAERGRNAASVTKEVKPIIEAFKKTANASDPIQQHLLWAAKDQLQNCSPPMERNLANATRSFKGTCTRPGGDWDWTFPCRQRQW